MGGVTVGIYDASLPESHQFLMSKIPVVWGNGLTEVRQILTVIVKFPIHDSLKIAHH